MHTLDLDLLRTALQRLDPTQPIQEKSHQCWYVEQPNGIARSLARTLQIDPTGSHLIVGSIGCGKSTEILASWRILNESPGIFAHYVEVSQAIDLDGADAVALVIAVVNDLTNHFVELLPEASELTEIREALKPFIEGYYVGPGQDDYFDNDYVYVAPLMKQPRPNVPETMVSYLPFLRRLQGFIDQRYDKAHLVLLLDGLDRLSNPTEFDQIVEPFLRTLKEVGIGIALVGPGRVISGLDRLGVAAVFDEIHWMGPIKPDKGSKGWIFLNNVLNARQLNDIVPIEQQESLIQWSGGAIRILLQMTREAIKEAWVRNVEILGEDQVHAAADKVGRALLLGLTDREICLLDTLLKKGVFAPRTAEESALILTNRVLEYEEDNGLKTHKVHPTLVSFAEVLAKISDNIEF